MGLLGQSSKQAAEAENPVPGLQTIWPGGNATFGRVSDINPQWGSYHPMEDGSRIFLPGDRHSDPSVSLLAKRNVSYFEIIGDVAGVLPMPGGAGRALGGSLRAEASVARGLGAAKGEVLSPFSQRYLTESGGRWGGTATRQQNYAISQELKSRGYTVRDGGGIGPEEYIAGAGPGSKGGTFVDITSTAPNGRTVRIQTITTRTLPDGTVMPTASEAAAAARIRTAFPNDKLLLTPKR